MKTTLSFWKTRRSPFATRTSHSDYLVALVTLAVVAWFSLALAVLGGEWRGAPASPATPPAATQGAPAPLPQASALPAIWLI
ncbi:MAG: hypothetical protein KIS74_16660 [Burkholderiales bacterium]|nr:hypothetical protein [Burkholderiales bacterium]